MTTVSLYGERGDPRDVAVAFDGRGGADVVVTGDDGRELARHAGTAFQVGLFGFRLFQHVLATMKGHLPPAYGCACELCGRPVGDRDYSEWRLPSGGRNAAVHDVCFIGLLEQRRRERKTGQPELFAVTAGGGA